MCHIKLQASCDKPAWFFWFCFVFLISTSICHSLHPLWEEKEKEKKSREEN